MAAVYTFGISVGAEAAIEMTHQMRFWIFTCEYVAH